MYEKRNIVTQYSESLLPVNGNTAKAEYWNCVGRCFRDNEEELEFRIDYVSSGSTNYFFEYKLISSNKLKSYDPEDYEYTPCEELLNAEWLEWICCK
jgi:hypothetical protein